MTSRYGRPLEGGLSIVPTSVDLELARTLARRADELGLDLIGIQDHPYQWRFFDTWALMADLLARTERIRFFPDVANLPLRSPAMMAKQAASLDTISGGRFARFDASTTSTGRSPTEKRAGSSKGRRSAGSRP